MVSISVIMPVYNVEEYLSEAIESILSQSFKDFELIIINDGSTDNSLNIANQYLLDDDRIKIFSQKNQGLSAARNKGIQESNGKYLYFFDSDDILEYNCLEYCESIFSKENVDVVFFSATPFSSGSHLEKVNQYRSYYQRFNANGRVDSLTYYSECTKERVFRASACLYMAKREIIIRDNLLFETGMIYEDELFVRELIFKTKFVFVTNSKFFLRRVRENSIMMSPISLEKIKSRVLLSEKVFSLYLKYKNESLKADAVRFSNTAIKEAQKLGRNIELISILKESSLSEIDPGHRKSINRLQYPIVFKIIFRLRKIFNL